MKQLLFYLLFSLQLSAQTQRYKACVIAFYNLENFYDTIRNPLINDEDFTPAGAKKYNSAIYLDKLEHMATVIAQIGKEYVPNGPALLGIAEIENDTVLSDLIRHPLLLSKKYRIIHYDSPDPRGIDVALLYQPAVFLPEYARPIPVMIPGNSKQAFYTRDILYVKGFLAGEKTHVYINHWPSRRGGEERSAPAREAAALACRKHIDSVLQTDPAARIIVMGDLNDDPDSPSVFNSLNAKADTKHPSPGQLYNPWFEHFRNGNGSLANQDAWGLFDQILLSRNWLLPSVNGFWFHKAHVFNPGFLKENTGRYKGYPMRTWNGNQYRGGYSDHFPTYIVLLKNLK